MEKIPAEYWSLFCPEHFLRYITENEPSTKDEEEIANFLKVKSLIILVHKNNNLLKKNKKLRQELENLKKLKECARARPARTGLKKFECDICNKSFSRKYSIKKHKVVVHIPKVKKQQQKTW